MTNFKVFLTYSHIYIKKPPKGGFPNNIAQIVVTYLQYLPAILLLLSDRLSRIACDLYRKQLTLTGCSKQQAF